MKLEGRYTLPAAPAAVWERLNDPAILAKSLPGVESLEPDGPDRYRARIQYRVGAISGNFVGTVELSEKKPPHSMRLKTSARGAPGFFNGDGRLALAAKGAETEVRYAGEIQVGGMLAALGQRMVESAARKSIEEFFQVLAASLKPSPG
ncbi:MAG TPA: carbon monoxide dehydrogenase subunit G [Candidatus Acidoferrales bacterium]|nr:carbon monoxide dehydrogenase subunit G [Candidatus Acidoferrales bacterium]